ncbi:MAG: type IV pilus twitching motility protein PilT [Coriobacteriia bacterium]|nr:type IV pilus twitching motility protein PilT [Coriobacteriia bacterium]
MDELLITMLEMGASDLHISNGSAPRVRVNGRLFELEGHPKFYGDDTVKVIVPIIPEKRLREYEETFESDLSYSLPGKSRFRVNVFRQRGAMGAVLRTIPFGIPTIKQLGLPQVCTDLADKPRGLVLVTGPTGSGKSTTLAAMIDYINETKAVHIVTMEDPIEFIHQNKKALVNQREIGEDTESFAAALKHVLRQDPDVILVGEMRDLETISAAITAAETGHLVFGTLHTIGGPETIDRIIDVFPPAQQNQIRMQLSGTLLGVLSQVLCETSDGKGRVLAQEIMLGIPAIGNLIREGKTHQMLSIIQSGGNIGMATLDHSLRQLFKEKKISAETALEKSQDAKSMAEQIGYKPSSSSSSQ